MTLLRLIVEHDGRRRELEVDVDSEATGRAIYDAVAPKLGVAADEYGLVVARSSEAIHPGARLNHYALRNAELVQVVPNHPGGPAPEDAPWQLKVVAGPAVGGVLSIRAGTLTLGRETDAGRYLRDDAISRSHVTISAASNQLTIADAGSTNGTYVNNGRINSAVSLREGDYVGLGETLLEVMQAKREVLPGHLTYDSGSLLFNRPPRVASEAPAAAYEIESAPETAPKQRVPLAASLIPVVLGLSTFVIVGLMSAENGGFKAQPQLLLMTLAGPLMAIVTYSSNKRSGRGDFEERRTKYLSSLEAIRKQASAARDRAVEWRHRRHLRSEVVVHSAVNLDASLWSRRPADDDFLELRLGTVDQPSLVQISNRGGGAPELAKTAADLTASMVLDKDVPIAISARDSGVVGLVGTSEQLDELARWWAVQIAAHHSPREVALAVIAPGAEASWDWAKWLPHSNVMASNRVTMATDDEEAETLFRMLRSVAKERLSAREGLIGSSGATHLPHVLLVVQPPLRMPAREMAEFLEQAPQAGMSVVWLAETRSALPGACQAIVELHGSGVTLTRSSGETVSSIRPDRVGLGDAARVGLSLAPLRDVAEAAADGGIPNRINLVDLIHPSPLAAQNVAAAWQRAPDSLSAVLGMGEGRPVFVDMIADGPHGLLGGTTGAGKSELLQTLIASLAVTYSPNRVNFVLVDYKGGAAFKDCVDLPHAVGFVTDLDGRLAERAIVSLDAELKSREHVLAAGGFKDVAEMRKRNPAEAPANLIIVVDEFAALKTEVPEFVDGVVDIAQRGRSLGVHLLLATQKPGGIISANIQANTNLRIALRVTDAGESSDIIGRPDAAKLSRHLPG
ncbi:MAG: FHA domain-containing protein, partial [bacterium]|nr:FHA domain-containing protein [bacterium]